MSATCDFNTPRIDHLLTQAVATNDFQPLVSFAEARLSIIPCAGTEGIKGGNGVKWFKPVNDCIPKFVCCEACYEDVVLGTSFGPNFLPYGNQQPTDQSWSCDLALPYLEHMLQVCARKGDWQGFVQAGRHRLSLQTCVKDVSTAAAAKKWYNIVRPSAIYDMTLCEACYLDRAGWQESLARNFAQVQFNPFEYTSHMLCDFRLGSMAACSDILLASGAFEKWHQFASTIMSNVRCKSEGIVDGEWYGLPDPADSGENIKNFDICAACLAGWFQSADWGHLFRRLRWPPGTTRLCDFNPSAPRHFQYLAKWNQMYFTRDPTPFIDYVARFASLEKCQGTHCLENANWYGDKDASLLICPSCFEEAVRGTHFATNFPLQSTQLASGNHCSLYSPRMREKYAEACKKRSLDSLMSFASHREQIYQQTVPHVELFQKNMKQKMELLKIAHQARSATVGATAIGRAFTGGNPIVHNFDPAVVTQTILLEGQRREIAYDPQRPRMMQLEAMWKEVE